MTAPDIDQTPVPGHHYVIGWIPSRHEMYTLVVRDTHDDTVVIYGRFSAESLGDQVKQVRRTSRHYYGAVVRAFAGFDDEMLFDLEVMGCYVQRVNFTPRARAAAIDNLSMLISKKRITIPANPNLIAELQVFKSEYTLDETPDYSLQSGAQSGIYALCLVTHDLNPDFDLAKFRGTIYYSYDPTLI